MASLSVADTKLDNVDPKVSGNPLAAFGPFHAPPHLIERPVALVVGAEPALSVDDTVMVPLLAFWTAVILAM